MKKQIVNIGDVYGSYTVTGKPYLEDNKAYKRKIEVTCKCGNKINAYYCNLKKLSKCIKCRGLDIRKFKPGDKINNFTIIGYENSKVKIQCICGYTYLSTVHEIGRTKICKHCSKKKIGNCHGSYKGSVNISGKEFSQIKNNAKRRNLEFDLTLEFLENLFVQQNYKCIYSGLTITIGNSKIEKTASLDRIDSSKGYLKNNVQWVHKTINRMKTDLKEDEFLNMIKLIYENKIKEKQ